MALSSYFCFAEIELRADSKRLIQLLQEILSTEDELESDGALDFGEDADIPSETLLPRPLITDFYMELSKLKSTNLAAEVSYLYFASSNLCSLSCRRSLDFVFRRQS